MEKSDKNKGSKFDSEKPSITYLKLLQKNVAKSITYRSNMSLYECVCGKKLVLITARVTFGHNKSCGCKRTELLRNSATIDSRSKDPLYDIWNTMRARCYNPKSTGYSNYGQRGIKVCDLWNKDFYAFKKDVGERPSRQHSLDRIDCDGNYSKENCRWSTRKEQSSNLRSNRLLTFNNETKTLAEWSRILNIPSSTISARFKYGWTEEEVLSTPRRKRE